MPVRRSRIIASRSGTRSQRRKLVWATLDLSQTVAAGAIQGVDLLAPLRTAGASVLGCTVMRTHVLFNPSLPAGTRDTWGLIVNESDNLVAPVRPDPSAVQEADWAWLDVVLPTFSGATADSRVVVRADVRSKRKVQEMNQTWAWMFRNQTAASDTFQLFVRTLIALP